MIHPLLERLFRTRNTDIPASPPGLKALLPATLLKGLEQAVERLDNAIRQQEQIVIIGDFDADGATSTALMMLVLKEMGARVNYVVPDRFKYGYGLTPEIVDLAVNQFQPSLIVTVDNGISSHAGVARAGELGADVIITDHHLSSRTPPAALAIVNPNQPGCEFPSKALAGVGVAFYVLAALSTRRSHAGLPAASLSRYLDLVALGTVADVAILDQNNRILVREGLRRISLGQCRPGIQALLQISGKKGGAIRAEDMGFLVGPRLNAAGRLESMTLGIETLLCDDAAEAYQKALRLDELNRERRQIEADMKEAALTLATLDTALGQSGDPGRSVILYQPDWHQGVIGIVAGRLKEQFYRPAFIFAPADAGSEWLKGSARSIPGIHIRDLIEKVALANPDLISHFGGHAMAAGLTLHRSRFNAFKLAVLEELATEPQQLFMPELRTDGILESDWHTLDTVQLIEEAGPWGHGFPPPVFEGEFVVIEKKLMKERHLRLRLLRPDSQLVLEGVAFNFGQWLPFEQIVLHQPLNVHYQLEANHFRGDSRLQVMIRYLAPIKKTVG